MSINTLRAQHTEAKALRKAAVAQHGPQSPEAAEAKRYIDRLYQSIKRVEAKGDIAEVIAEQVVEHVTQRGTTKAAPLTDADVEKGIYARRKVRATGHIVERIDGKVNELGTDGGRWVLRIVGSRKAPKRFDTRKALNKAARKA